MPIERIETKSITIRWLVNGYVAGSAEIRNGELLTYDVARRANIAQDSGGFIDFTFAVVQELKAQQNTRD